MRDGCDQGEENHSDQDRADPAKRICRYIEHPPE